MGGLSSRSNSTDKCEFSGPEFYLPEDLMIEILSHVPPRELLRNCIVVCRQWKNLIMTHAVWKRICVREKKTIPILTNPKIPKHFYRMIALCDPYGRNLLKNPCGEDGLQHWVIHSNIGQGWKVESPPVGADEIPEVVGSQACFATSYGLCVKYQIIDLRKEGVTEDVMDVHKPDIVIGEWHAARFDCGSVYTLSVSLLDKNKREVTKCEFGPFTEDQWSGRAWSKFTHRFCEYPTGVRYIEYEHSGQDTQFWAGHYGSKMTGGFVRIDFVKCKVPRVPFETPAE